MGRILITGHRGFIGRVVTAQLEAAGVEVVGLDRLDCDRLSDDEVVAERVRGCDAVVHLAAKVGLERSFDDAPAYVADNDLGTATLLRACAGAGVERVVLASSMVVYGEGRYHCAEHGVVAPAPRRPADLESGTFEPPCPVCGAELEPGLVPESAPLDPRSVYAATKVALEHLSRIWADRTDGVAVALRYHNVYGPGMPRDTPYAGVTSLFRTALARGEAPRVFEDGAQRRNFVHVADVAAATAAAVSAPLDPGLTPLNIGSASITTVGEMARLLADRVGGAEPVITGEYRAGDVRHITADCSRAPQLLDWSPRIDLRTGLTSVEAD